MTSQSWVDFLKELVKIQNLDPSIAEAHEQIYCSKYSESCPTIKVSGPKIPKSWNQNHIFFNQRLNAGVVEDIGKRPKQH